MRLLHLGITLHARERYLQRFMEPLFYRHLGECCLKYCQKCAFLKVHLNREAIRLRSAIELEMAGRIEAGSEEKEFLNDHKFMEYVYSHYGYDRVRFALDGDCLFLIRSSESNGNPTVITVLNAAQGDIRHSGRRKKWGNQSSRLSSMKTSHQFSGLS